MTGPDFTLINGVKISTKSIQWADPEGSRPDGARNVQLKNGVSIYIPKGQQNKNAQITTSDISHTGTSTFGYNLNNVKISGGEKNDNIWLTDSKNCFVRTDHDGESDRITFQYTNRNHGKNLVFSDSKDHFTVIEDYYPRKETKLDGKINGHY